MLAITLRQAASKRRWLSDGLLLPRITCQLNDMHKERAGAVVSLPSFHNTSSTARMGAFCKLVAHKFSTKSIGEENAEGPVAVDYRTLLDEREFHRLADSTLHDIQEKIDELGEGLDVEGFDTDHAEGVLTIKLGPHGTYVINKQTPNRQIWLSSPVSGPARFDWDSTNHCWIYRRTKSNLYGLLEDEFEKLLGASLTLSK